MNELKKDMENMENCMIRLGGRTDIWQAHEFLDVTAEVRRLIDGVKDPRFHELLCRRYLFNQRWERIAVDMGYDFRYLLKLHKRAIEQIHRQITGGHKG